MENKNDKVLWASALGVFSEISTWIAVPIILAVIIGKALDNHYGTHWLIIVSAGLSFLLSSYGIVKAVRKYADKINKEGK